MLDLSHTGMGNKGLTALVASLYEGAWSQCVESLKLDYPMYQGPFDHVITQLCEALARCQNMKELSLGGFQMDDHEFAQFVHHGIKRCDTIVSLSLRGNRISGLSSEALGTLVKMLPQLEELDLAGNRLGDAGVTALCQAVLDLGAECNMWRLDLRDNHLTDLGIEAVLETVANCSTLQYVQLWGNRFGPSSSETLAEVLQQLQDQGRELAIDCIPFQIDGRWQTAKQ